MINVTFRIDQLKINSTQIVCLNQQIVSEIRRILYKSGIDLSDWESIQCQVTYNDQLQDFTKTFNEAGVKDSSILFIKLSMLITLEIVNKQFPSLEINVDAFDSTQKFKDLMIQNHLRNNQFDIIIINGLDGKVIEKDTWIENGVVNSIPILLNIQIKQSIFWKGELLDWNFNVFNPISKVIQNIKNKLNINGIISLQCQNTHLKPELSYFNHNLPLNVNWQASVPNELIYRVYFQKLSREKQYICGIDKQINDVIKQLRKDFNINRTNKIILMYQWALDQHATFAQEAIPNYSLLKLVEEEYKGEFQIFLQNISENAQQIQSIQTQQVNNDTSLGELSRKIPHQNDQEVIFFFESQDQILGIKQRMEDLNIYYGATIMYKIVQQQNELKKIEQKPKITTIQRQIQYKKFGVLVIDINIVINIEISIQNNLLALAEVIRYKLSLSRNQIIHFSLGTKLLQLNENIYEIMDGKFEFLQAKLQMTIKIYFQNKHSGKGFEIDVKLEDTLRKVSEKLKIEAKFQHNNVFLGLDETFTQLKIENGETIIFDLTSTPKEDIEIQISGSSQSNAKNNGLHQASPFNSNAIDNENQQQLKSQQNSNQFQADQPINNLNDTLITVKAQGGEKVYKFQMKGSDTFLSLKKAIFELAVQGDEQNIKEYILIHGEQVLRDEQVASSLNKQEIEIQFKLK